MTFETPDTRLQWYAIHIRSNYEQRTARALRGKGLDPFLPMYRERYDDGECGVKGRRPAETPLFSGYIFCRFDAHNRLPILTTPGVVCIVGTGKVPEPLDPEEMVRIQALTQFETRVTPFPYPPIGKIVRLERGPLSGIDGVILAHKGQHHLVVSATLLQRSIAIEVERTWMTRVYRQGATAHA